MNNKKNIEEHIWKKYYQVLSLPAFFSESFSSKASTSSFWCNSVPLRHVSWMQNFKKCCRSVGFSPIDLFFLATRNSGGGGGKAGIGAGGFGETGGAAWAFAEEECWGCETGDCILPETGPDAESAMRDCNFRSL